MLKQLWELTCKEVKTAVRDYFRPLSNVWFWIIWGIVTVVAVAITVYGTR